MGLRTTDELIADTRLMLDNRTDLTAAQMLNWVNQAYNHISQPEVRWHRELETVYDITLVAAQSSYAVDSVTVGFTILDIVDVTFYDATAIAETTTRRDVQPREINWWNRQTLSSRSGGPSHYTWWKDEIKFASLPATADASKIVRMEVYRDPAVLTAGTGTTSINRYFDRGIALGAKWMAELDLGYAEQAEASRQEYAAWINEKRNATNMQSRDTRQRTQIRHESYMDRS